MSDAIQIHKTNGANGALQTMADTTWTQERVDLVKRAICPKGISNDEFALFMEQCKRSGLDPMLKEIFCVPRRKNIGNKQDPKWITTHEAQPSEAGMLARAEKFPDFRGITAAAVHAQDKISLDIGAGTVSHSFSPVGNRGHLVGAWARIEREGRTPVVVWLPLDGYKQDSPLWGKIPGTMIEKCARVAVLRKAYPGPFGALYIKEEMPAEEFPQERVATVAPPVAQPVRPALVRATVEDAEIVNDAQEPTPDELAAVLADADREAMNLGPSPREKACILIDEATTQKGLLDLTTKILELGVAKDEIVRERFGRKQKQLKGTA